MGNATDAGYLLAPDACQHGLMQIATMPQCTEATVTEASDIDSLKSIFFKNYCSEFQKWHPVVPTNENACKLLQWLNPVAQLGKYHKDYFYQQTGQI